MFVRWANNYGPLELIVAAAFALGVAYSWYTGRRTPKEKTFRCARCSNMAPHTLRTINAWRDGKTTFFCNSCHSEWVRSHPQQRMDRAGSRGGCLGVLACLAFIPLSLILVWLGW